MTRIPFSYDDQLPAESGTPESRLLDMQLAVLDAEAARIRRLPKPQRQALQQHHVRTYNRYALQDALAISALVIGLLLGLSALVTLGVGLWHFFTGLRVGGQTHIALGALLPLLSIPLFKASYWILLRPYPELRQAQEQREQEQSGT